MRRKKTINVIENGTLDSKVREYDCRKMYHLVSFISGHNCCAYILKCTISQHLLLNLLLLITKVNNDTIYYDTSKWETVLETYGREKIRL